MEVSTNPPQVPSNCTSPVCSDPAHDDLALDSEWSDENRDCDGDDIETDEDETLRVPGQGLDMTDSPVDHIHETGAALQDGSLDCTPDLVDAFEHWCDCIPAAVRNTS